MSLLEGSPSKFARPEVQFKKLDDLPQKGLGKPYTPEQIMKAMRALHRMIHAQAEAYGGSDSKLLQAGIAEGQSLLSTVTEIAEEAPEVDDAIEQHMDKACAIAEDLGARLGEEESTMVFHMLQHLRDAMSVTLTEGVSPGEQKRRQELYTKWRELINMSAESLENFKEKQLAAGKKDPKKYPGLKPKDAHKIGISAGVQSANWIIKMKRTPVKDWTPEMWKWAGKQVSFVSRMKGNDGPLYDENGEPTRKLLSLKIWGHNPR